MKAIGNRVVEMKSSDSAKQAISYKSAYTARELYNMKILEVPFLLEGLIPKTGIVCLTGSSDCNKSTLLRQLAIDIVLGKELFLGFKLIASHKRCIYISTEDDYFAISALLNKQYSSTMPEEALDNIYFMFNTEGHIEKLDKILTETKTDLVVLDNWADVFPGDINQTNKVRASLKPYSQLAQKHGCAFVVVHHQGKRSEEKSPNKNNLLGSQGIEAKVRTLVELRRDSGNRRLLTVIKGNYTKDSIKGKSFVLEISEDTMLLQRRDEILISEYGFENIKSNKEDMKKQVVKLKADGLSFEKIQKKLVEQFGKEAPSLTTVKNWDKGQSVSPSPSK
jgi:RecA-family ATPase